MAVLWQLSADGVATADMPNVATTGDFNSLTVTGGGMVGNMISTVNAGFCKGTTSTDQTFWMHFRVKWPNDSYVQGPVGSFCYGLAQTFQFHIDSSRHLYICDVGYSGLTWDYFAASWQSWNRTGTYTFSYNTWYSIGIEIYMHASAGYVKSWVNGAQDINATGLDTMPNTGYPYTTAGSVYGTTAYFDDIVLGNGAGSINTSPTYELRVDCQLPDANGTDRANGGTGEMTRSTGSDDYALVNETAPSTDTGDYLYADAVGEKCSVNVSAMTNTGGTIVAVMASTYATKNGSGTCGFKIYCLRGGTRYYSGAFYPSWGGFTFYTYTWDKDPATDAAWIEANFNAAEFGVERTA